jgi:hypothetical protein
MSKKKKKRATARELYFGRLSILCLCVDCAFSALLPNSGGDNDLYQDNFLGIAISVPPTINKSFELKGATFCQSYFSNFQLPTLARS